MCVNKSGVSDHNCVYTERGGEVFDYSGVYKGRGGGGGWGREGCYRGDGGMRGEEKEEQMEADALQQGPHT